MWVKLKDNNKIVNLDRVLGFEVLANKIVAILPNWSTITIYEGK